MRRTSSWSVLHMLSVILFYCIMLMLSSPHCCYARDNITKESKLGYAETLVSAGNKFELGFFDPYPRSSNVKRYVGIWYTSDPQTVVWVANRRNPLPGNGAVVSIADGKLKLSYDKGNIYWSIDLGLKHLLKPGYIVAKLEDTGNFVLYDYRLRQIIWQSFDQPTDTFLFGMQIGEKCALTSWISEEDPAPGNFTFTQDGEGRDQFVVKEKSITYWKSRRPDSGNNINDPNELTLTIVNFLKFKKNITEDFSDNRMVMNFTGDLQYWRWDLHTKNWYLVWWVPTDKCSRFNYCGNFGTCNGNYTLPCKCLPGFKPKFPEKWKAADFSDGCSRKNTSSSSSCANEFLSLKRMKFRCPDSPFDAKDEKECREECNRNCQCQAYSYAVQRRRGSDSCLLWTEELKDLQEDQDGGHDLNVRVLLSDRESTVRNCENCGTYLVPFPLSTGLKCGDPMYSSFYCNDYTEQLSFMAPSGNYNVISVDPEARTFFIQMQSKEAENCSFLKSSASRILQLNKSSPFSLTSWCSSDLGNFTTDSSLNGTVAISWNPPPEPTCTSSADCEDWPDSTCNQTGNGPKRCLCNTNFLWDGSALNCTRASVAQGGQTVDSSHGNEPLPLILGVSLATAIASLCAVVSICMWRRKVAKRRVKQRKAALYRYDTERRVKELMDSNQFEEQDHGTGIDVPFFDLESILAATDNFSEENKLGKGGFGPVYKGKFPGGQEIAVKRLSSVSGQGLEEFKNEVVLIAKLQHRNLVRLLGYCIREEEKILLYEYMPNKSLDTFIFDESFSQQLDWETRFNIILGIARGLLYLHQDSRLRIIHRDLKTSNILLDAEMNPRISDFGLARMIQGKETEAKTLRVVGTYGYLAPEYALDGLFSVKSDVFSFGIMMLEIISGKKNMRFYQVENAPNLTAYAWRLWEEDRALDLMDETIQASCNTSEFLRCVHVGLLCVQEDPSDRPTMSDVVLLLGSDTVSLPIPKQPAFGTRRTLSTTASTSSKAEPSSEINSTLEEGR